MTKQKKRDNKMLLVMLLTNAERYLRSNNKIVSDKAILCQMKQTDIITAGDLVYYDIPKIRLLRKEMVSKLS